MASILFTESSGGYAQRTRENAAAADYTVAIASDFTTAGERATERAAGDRYVAIPLDADTLANIPEAARRDARLLSDYLVKNMPGAKDGVVLNLAGNGLYTLARSGVSQKTVDGYVTALLAEMKAIGDVAIAGIRSGGQTGVDEAAAKAALANDIDAVVHAPKGYEFRGANGRDVYDEAAFKARFGVAQKEAVSEAVSLEDARLMRRALYLFETSDWTSWASDDPKTFERQKKLEDEYMAIMNKVSVKDPELAGKMKAAWEATSSKYGADTEEGLALQKELKKRSSVSGLIVNHEGPWTREEAAADVRTLYVFTDNTDRDSGKGVISRDSAYFRRFWKFGSDAELHYPTMTAAVVRGLDNAMPVSTQRWYHEGAKGESGRWTDNDVAEFKDVVSREFQYIRSEWRTGQYDRIMFPDGDGLFNGKISAITPERTPLLYVALKEEYDNLVKYVGVKEQIKESNAEAVKETPEARLATEKDRLMKNVENGVRSAGWGRYADNGYEVSTRGDRRFSALVATFAPGTKIGRVDVGGKSIEDVYQTVIKRSGKGLPPAEDSVLYQKDLSPKDRELVTFDKGYLPLWTIWAGQNPALIDDLRQKSAGKTLTDMFASTGVSQARALDAILNGKGHLFDRAVAAALVPAGEPVRKAAPARVAEPTLDLKYDDKAGVTVANIKTTPEVTKEPGYVYIGRSKGGEPENILSNPYTMIPEGTRAQFVVSSRQESVDRYKDYMEEQMKTNPAYKAKLEELAGRVADGEHLFLGCFCKPLPCHGDILKEKILEMAMGKKQDVGPAVDKPATANEKKSTRPVYHDMEEQPEKAYETLDDLSRERLEGFVPKHHVDQIKAFGATEIHGMVNSRIPTGYDPNPSTLLVNIELRLMKDEKGNPAVVVLDPNDRLPDGTMPKYRTVLGTLDRYTRHGRFDLAGLQRDQRFWQGVREKRAARHGQGQVRKEQPGQKEGNGLGKR